MSSDSKDRPTGSVAIIGGTGALGGGLAWRCARAGYRVIIGSRSPKKAADAAREMSVAGAVQIEGLENCAAAEAADMLLVAVPFASQSDTLRAISGAARGKIVVDTTVPLVPPKVARVQLPEAGSAAVIAADTLGPEVRLVTGFHNVSAQKLREEGTVECDILVFGDDVEAREIVIDLIQRMGLRGVHGGPLANSAAAEALTSVLIAVNRRYRVTEGAGIRITGLDKITVAD